MNVELIRKLISAHIPKDADPGTLPRSVAFFQEITRCGTDDSTEITEPLPFEQIALLMAYQQLIIEGLAQQIGELTNKLEGRKTVEKANENGGITPIHKPIILPRSRRMI